MEGIYVTIRTSLAPLSGSYNIVWVSLIGSRSECPAVRPFTDDQRLLPGSSCTILIKPDEDIGKIVLVRLRLEARPGFPNLDWHCLDVQLKLSSDAAAVECFPCDSPGNSVHYLKGFHDRSEPWSSMKELETLFIYNGNENTVSTYVHAHWKEDAFFGYQCLNGCNPLIIRRIHCLPPSLDVTSQMLKDFLPEGSSLGEELEKGTIFLLDYEVLDGLPANVINGKQSYIAAPLCLLHYNQHNELKPIAIQLLMPHLKTSLQINIQARASLLATNGVFDKAVGCGMKAVPVLLARGTYRLRYTSLCVPDDLKERGLDKLPNCYYAQDALRVWNALHRFVASWVELYYHDDQEVQQDAELQSWIQEIHTEGYLGFIHTDFPQTFQTIAELSKYITMVIFTSSALHAAVNFSQASVDFNLWMPNCPAAMLRPPPQVKGTVTEEDLLSFFPDVNSTCRVLIVLFMLSQPSLDYVPLCHYREWYFSSGAPLKLVEKVQQDLRDIAHDIQKRNSRLELAYPYLYPDNIENSVAI
ncbi:Hydroperoxide isomerase ALOXE3 [Bagarius yarrelli]|uniref:Hydroperoxide isomerase ALOXE3 n=1 Tax=Bagarius yarrelli TaxID=175774 RepID=A0A556TX40_BAGYA|nr:Hydroperoxide isomerase ALOXE3 [Bagarius yarrelli]